MQTTSNISSTKRAFDFSKFKLPSTLSEDIQKQFRSKKRLTVNQEHFISRALVAKIRKQTMHPHSAVYSRIAEMFLQQNNHLVYNDDLESTKVINSIISFYFSHFFFLSDLGHLCLLAEWSVNGFRANNHLIQGVGPVSLTTMKR